MYSNGVRGHDSLGKHGTERGHYYQVLVLIDRRSICLTSWPPVNWSVESGRCIRRFHARNSQLDNTFNMVRFGHQITALYYGQEDKHNNNLYVYNELERHLGVIGCSWVFIDWWSRMIQEITFMIQHESLWPCRTTSSTGRTSVPCDKPIISPKSTESLLIVIDHYSKGICMLCTPPRSYLQSWKYEKEFKVVLIWENKRKKRPSFYVLSDDDNSFHFLRHTRATPRMRSQSHGPEFPQSSTDQRRLYRENHPTDPSWPRIREWHLGARELLNRSRVKLI